VVLATLKTEEQTRSASELQRNKEIIQQKNDKYKKEIKGKRE
jgi:hypothetical protein